MMASSAPWTTSTVPPYQSVATKAGHIDSDADNNKDLLDLSNDLGDFSVADFVDYTQTVANFRAINGGTMSRINFANRIMEENKINLESAWSHHGHWHFLGGIENGSPKCNHASQCSYGNSGKPNATNRPSVTSVS